MIDFFFQRDAPNDLFDLIRRMQSSRIEGQRCELPMQFNRPVSTRQIQDELPTSVGITLF